MVDTEIAGPSRECHNNSVPSPWPGSRPNSLTRASRKYSIGTHVAPGRKPMVAGSTSAGRGPLNDDIASLAGEAETRLGQHPGGAMYLSQPDLGPILGARVLSEFGDDPDHYAEASARKILWARARSPETGGKSS